MTDYIIRASLHDEANEGWVWVEDFPSRSLIKISSRAHGRDVVCQTRKLDENFKRLYNAEGAGRIEINLGQNTIVMSEWYRHALGGFNTTKDDNANGKVALDIQRYRGWQPLGQLRAASQHPDIVVRLGARLGALGAWLGLLGSGLGFLSLFQPQGCARLVVAAIVGLLVIIVGAVLIQGCRGVIASLEEQHG